MSAPVESDVGTGTGPLPEYDHPPVGEVVLAVYFDDPLGFNVFHVGALRERFLDRFPGAEEQPELAPVAHEFSAMAGISVRFDLTAAPSRPRLWFTSADHREVVQVQRDRIVHNWRRLEDDDVYPRYANLRPQFVEDITALQAFAADVGLTMPSPAQCEVSYFNPVPVTALGSGPESLLAPWSGSFSDSFLRSPEDVALQARFRIRGAGSDDVGRLYVTAQPAQRRRNDDNEDIVMLQLVARGRPLGDGVEGALAFLDLGHEWVVRGFSSLTTAEMHRHWARRA